MSLLLFGIFILLILVGMPIAFAILMSAMAVLFDNGISMLIVPQRMFADIDSFPLIAVPFFIFAGDLMAHGSISKYLIDLAEAMLGKMRGGLSLVAVVAGMFFAAISGSGAAATAAVGTILTPRMKERGYNVEQAAALIASSGTIGVVIPPSVPMVLYAVIAGQSVARLFRNGFVPGILMSVVLLVIAVIQAYKQNYPVGVAFSFKNLTTAFVKSIWGLMMPVIILGGIFGGFFTPSEAAVVAVVYSILVSMFIYRDMNLKTLYKIMVNSALTSAVIMIIISASGAFGWVLANFRIPQEIATATISLSDNPFVIMILLAFLIIVAGIFMETASAMIILTPVFLPLITQLGIDPVHFGIFFVVGIAIGKITPPVAINLFVASSVTGIPIEKISKNVMPYFLGLIFVFLIMLFLPMLLPWMIVA